MSNKRKVLQGSASNIVRMLFSILAALVLPRFLVHRLAPAEYGAWILILQLSAYVNYFDFGLQAAIGKFVAEYDAKGDHAANRRLVSTSFTILTAAAILSSAMIGVMVWYVPELFHQMPRMLVSEVRLSLLAVGLSSAFALPFNAFSAIFTGLQRYVFPTAIAGFSRIGSAAVLIAVLFIHVDLFYLALVIAGFNVAAAVAQWAGWKRYASLRIGFSFLSFDRDCAIRLAKYCGLLSVWTLAMLFISGLDTVIVGHYDFKQTGYYGIASNATNFMLMVVGSLFSPLLPAISALQTTAQPGQIGNLSIRTTRYCTLILCLLGLPLFFGAYPALRLWVGTDYATRSALFLQVLVLGNVVRQLTYPYALTVVATAKQHLATLSCLIEASVNVALSIWLVQKMGAIGVAIGTLAGAFVGVAIHITVSMHFTQPTIEIRRSRFVLQGLARPLLCILPSLMLYPFWQRWRMLPASPLWLVVWVVMTGAVIWLIGLSADDRREFRGAFLRLLYWRLGRA